MIKTHATWEVTSEGLALEGTMEFGDIIADILSPFPKKLPVGTVSLGPYIQAEEIYKKNKDYLNKLPYVKYRGHSLGAGIAPIIAILQRLDGYEGIIFIEAIGGLKTLSYEAMMYLKDRDVFTEWRVLHRDPVPHIPFWYAPWNETEKEGEERKWFLDYDFDLTQLHGRGYGQS